MDSSNRFWGERWFSFITVIDWSKIHCDACYNAPYVLPHNYSSENIETKMKQKKNSLSMCLLNLTLRISVPRFKSKIPLLSTGIADKWRAESKCVLNEYFFFLPKFIDCRSKLTSLKQSILQSLRKFINPQCRTFYFYLINIFSHSNSLRRNQEEKWVRKGGRTLKHNVHTLCPQGFRRDHTHWQDKNCACLHESMPYTVWV